MSRLSVASFRPRQPASSLPDSPIAIIDIGSNSVRLVIYEGAQRCPRVLVNERAICGLGRDIQISHRLNPDGVTAALKTLHRFAILIDSMQVDSVDILATSAVREADDGQNFIRQIEKLFAYQVHILSGVEEGRLAGMGVLAVFPDACGVVGDLGGGSLELAILKENIVKNPVSLPLGPLRLVGQKEVSKAARLIHKTLKEVPFLKKQQGRIFYAVGGAWRVLGRLHMRQTDYPLRILQGYRIEAGEMEALADSISRQTPQSLVKNKEIPNRRAEMLPHAAFILAALLKQMKPESVVFPEAGLREGRLFTHLPKQIMQQDPLETISREYEARFSRFGVSGGDLEAWISPLFDAPVATQKHRLRQAVCRFSDIAWQHHSHYRALEALQTMLWMPTYGVDHAQRAYMALALFVRYGGRPGDQAVAPALALLDPDDATSAALCGAALSLAYAASGSLKEFLRQSHLGVIQDTEGEKRLTLSLTSNAPFAFQETLTRRLSLLSRIGGYQKYDLKPPS